MALLFKQKENNLLRCWSGLDIRKLKDLISFFASGTPGRAEVGGNSGGHAIAPDMA